MNRTTKVGPFGSGIGGPVQITSHLKNPSFDPATATKRDRRIAKLLESSALTEWERNFLTSIYGVDRMSAKQVKAFIRIHSRIRKGQVIEHFSE